MSKTTPLYIAILLLITQLFAVKAIAIDINGEEKRIDTLEYRKVGPGIEYYRVYLPDYPFAAYILKTDLNNPYNFIETFQAHDHLKRTEEMTQAYDRLTYENHTAIAGVNANFWIVSVQGIPNQIGIPHSGSMRHGEMITDPNNWNSGHPGSVGFTMIDFDKKLWIDDIEFSGVVDIPNAGSFRLAQINRERGANQVVLFNHFIGEDTPTRSDDDGIEVFIKPIANQKWRANEKVTCEVTRIITDKGENLLEEGETVLSGHGTGRVFLENLDVGDELTVIMNIETLTDNQYPSISEMVTGNALVMKNGELTVRNENEGYNSQLYPRTGIGSSQDGKTLFLIVIERNGLYSAAANTASMCGLLKSFGAWDVATMDGGGSAQMMLDGEIVNAPADGKERAVANGWFVFHNAPEDHATTDIAFADLRYDIPFLASYKPQIIAYNQYGVLINKDFQDYQLSCSEGLGEITEDGTFIANGNKTQGTLTVSYGDVSISKEINIILGDISFRLDSILINNKRKYPVEIQSKVGNDVLSVAPNLLQWRTELEDVVSVDQGVVTGLFEGMTVLHGSFGDMKDSMKVYVEIPTSNSLLFDTFDDEENPWKLKASSHLSAKLSTENMPTSWDGGATVEFTFKTGRAPYIRLTNQIPLYSLPDSLIMTINTGRAAIEKAILSLRANNNRQTVSAEFTEFESDGETVLKVDLHDLFDTDDMGIYPIWMDNINFYLLNMTQQQKYTLAFKDIKLIYNDYEATGIQNPKEKSTFIIYPNPVKNQDVHIALSEKEGDVVIELNDIFGRTIISQKTNNTQGNHIKLATQNLPSGYYLISITQNGKRQVQKLIIQ